jgi:hypothetical protein
VEEIVIEITAPDSNVNIDTHRDLSDIAVLYLSTVIKPYNVTSNIRIPFKSDLLNLAGFN